LDVSLTFQILCTLQINTVISNPRVVQDQFVGRAAKAQEERLSVAQAELRNEVQNAMSGMAMMDSPGAQGQGGPQGPLTLQQRQKLIMANPAQAQALQQQQQMAQQQLSMMRQHSAAGVNGGQQANGASGQPGMMAGGMSNGNVGANAPGAGGAQQRQGSTSGSNTPSGSQQMTNQSQTAASQQFVVKISEMSHERREEIFRKVSRTERTSNRRPSKGNDLSLAESANSPMV
jgi:hypothetical protein